MDWNKSKVLEEMKKNYSDDQLFDYPSFAQNKLPKSIKIFTVIPEKFISREEVLEWVDKNMSEEQIAYVGY